MSDPFSYLPYALAAHGGRVDGHPAASLVTAGFRLLQGSAPLVRALSGKRAAICLPPGAGFLTALAACDGRGALLLSPDAAADAIAGRCARANVGAVFTTAERAPRIPAELPRVLLHDAQAHARVVLPDRDMTVALSAHEGMSLEGDPEVEGADEEALLLALDAGTPDVTPYTHRFLLQRARRVMRELELTAADRILACGDLSDPFFLMMSWLAPLGAGAEVCTTSVTDAGAVWSRVAAGDVTMLAAPPALLAALLDLAETRGLAAGALRAALCGGGATPPELATRWAAATGVPLRTGRA